MSGYIVTKKWFKCYLESTNGNLDNHLSLFDVKKVLICTELSLYVLFLCNAPCLAEVLKWINSWHTWECDNLRRPD